MFGLDLKSRRRSRIGLARDLFLLSAGLILSAVTGLAGSSGGETDRLRIAFEITRNESFESLVSNVEGLQANFGDLADITVVASFEGVLLFRASGNIFKTRLARLADGGVDFVVCQNSIEALEIKKPDLFSFARLTRSGVAQIEQFVEQGWARVGDGESYVSNL